jgi:hypothetical protein
MSGGCTHGCFCEGKDVEIYKPRQNLDLMYNTEQSEHSQGEFK